MVMRRILRSLFLDGVSGLRYAIIQEVKNNEWYSERLYIQQKDESFLEFSERLNGILRDGFGDRVITAPAVVEVPAVAVPAVVATPEETAIQATPRSRSRSKKVETPVVETPATPVEVPAVAETPVVVVTPAPAVVETPVVPVTSIPAPAPTVEKFALTGELPTTGEVVCALTMAVKAIVIQLLNLIGSDALRIKEAGAWLQANYNGKVIAKQHTDGLWEVEPAVLAYLRTLKK